MSGESRRPRGWLLPAIVVACGALFLLTAAQQGALKPAALRPVNWAGIAAMVAGVALAFAGRRAQLLKLAGVLTCGIGAIMVICL